MAEKNEFGAIPLFLQGRDFILQQTVDDHPGKRAAKVDDLVHGKGHDAGGEDVVLHVGVPGRPHLLEDIELGVVCGRLLELGPGDEPAEKTLSMVFVVSFFSSSLLLLLVVEVEVEAEKR
ncbi:uncharacterized protein ARB_06031 [Trichophyton benhamiae CBS 112371]|uniref:Uncharacterized protein n=1 Tax=Arthroderma benhamiae (strain ATCC MYA-4681 / CBS 112371) TaxID=663331 RepID=D4AP64_ARTBC|nr:uncharacterized protein ARB_06031 [Trichophyton benhamiae CBS 112371]EFE35075.1 hypothetical protein ARB_06031 [Trichophyton benhamiae CBS 112371]